jgi:hypothetical protein
VGDTGPRDLAQTVRDEGEPDSQSFLTKNHFVRAFQRLWKDSANDQIFVVVVQFGEPQGAQAYAARGEAKERTATSGAGATLSSFTVPGIPSARGFNVVGSDRSAAAVEFTKSVYWARVIANNPGSAVKTELVQRLARTQFDLL